MLKSMPVAYITFDTTGMNFKEFDVPKTAAYYHTLNYNTTYGLISINLIAWPVTAGLCHLRLAVRGLGSMEIRFLPLPVIFVEQN